MRKMILALFMGSLLWIGNVQAGDPARGEYAPDAPIKVTSDRLEGSDADGRVIFKGSVVARQGDVSIYADELVVVYAEASRDIDRVEALGQVRIVQGERVASGDRGVFSLKQGRIVLTGSPRIFEDGNYVSGEEITVLLDEQKSIISGGQDGRVEAVIQPGGGKP